MPLNNEEIIERALEQAFAKALEQTVQNKAEALFQKALANGTPFWQRLEQKIAEGFQRFLKRAFGGRRDGRGSRNDALDGVKRCTKIK